MPNAVKNLNPQLGKCPEWIVIGSRQKKKAEARDICIQLTAALSN
jgi:hypothetical protein